MKKASKQLLSLRRPAFGHAGTLGITLPTLLLSGQAFAQSEEPIVLDTLQIEERTVDTNPYAEPGAPYKAKISGDTRHTRPIADTPQIISVLTQTEIKDSGKTDLKDIVAAQPGITLGTGENGNAFGDRYIIRGHEARSDVFVDGLRDPGMTTRESFATEQVEITKGPSSTFAGRGSTGGAINSITKQASTEYNFNKVEGGLGSSDFGRVTVDSNTVLNDDLAIRINGVYSTEDVPSRDPADRERKGVALSTSYDVTDKFNVMGDYYYLDAKDKPDLGTYIVPDGGGPVSDIPVYLQSQDFLKSETNTYTLRANYEVSSKLRLDNSMRYGETNNGYVTTGARGTTLADSDPVAPGSSNVSLSTHQGWQDVDYFVDRFNVYLDQDIAGFQNEFIFSLEYSDLKVKNGVYDVTNTGTTNCVTSGRRGDSPGYCIYDANGNRVGNLQHLMGREINKGAWDSHFKIETTSLSIMDTVDIHEDWTVFAGVRYDDFDYNNDVISGGETTKYSYSDGLWNGHIGVVYDVTEQGNVYFTYSTSSNINGGESDLGGNCGYGGICGDETQITNSKPEKTENIELGTKWNILNDKLLATAAVFQITKDDVMESVGDDYESLGTLNTGKNRVTGIEFSLSGNITEELSVFAGASFMHSDILKSYNEPSEGNRLSNFADDSAYLQLRYQATPKFSFGGTVTYSSEMYAGQPDSAAGFDPDTGEYSYEIPSYTVYDLFASYTFTEKLNARLNVGNIMDDNYYLAAYRSGAFTYIGDARNVQLYLTYEF
ncbi:putative TonB-dependent receptor BfrD [Halioglobus japonicus]|nr:putative TonB-dependent receptor BfrD [Halioglobus japonicus]